MLNILMLQFLGRLFASYNMVFAFVFRLFIRIYFLCGIWESAHPFSHWLEEESFLLCASKGRQSYCTVLILPERGHSIVVVVQLLVQYSTYVRTYIHTSAHSDCVCLCPLFPPPLFHEVNKVSEFDPSKHRQNSQCANIRRSVHACTWVCATKTRRDITLTLTFGVVSYWDTKAIGGERELRRIDSVLLSLCFLPPSLDNSAKRALRSPCVCNGIFMHAT